MHWHYTLANKELLNKAQDFLPQDYQALLKSPAQLISRALLAQMAKEKFNIKNFLALSNEDEQPQQTDGLYWSVSYKIKDNETHIAAALARKPIGIDIEIIEPRSEEFLTLFSENEYKLLGGKNWQNFFTLWTTKEALIKKLSLTLDDMKNIQCIYTKKDTLILFHKGIKYEIQTLKKEDVLIALSM